MATLTAYRHFGISAPRSFDADARDLLTGVDPDRP